MIARLFGTMVIFIACIAYTQDNLCQPASASTSSGGSGVVVQRITLSGPWGSNDATVLLPDKEVADGGIVFSHSRIRSDGKTVDMLPLAMTLAVAGAAVIVPDRSITWPPTETNMNREGPIVSCAAQWLIANVRVFKATESTVANGIVIRVPFAYVGPRLCARSECVFYTPFSVAPYYQFAWVPVAETEGGDNTPDMLSGTFLKKAQWLQKRLGLAPIKQIVDVTSLSSR